MIKTRASTFSSDCVKGNRITRDAKIYFYYALPSERAEQNVSLSLSPSLCPASSRRPARFKSLPTTSGTDLFNPRSRSSPPAPFSSILSRGRRRTRRPPYRPFGLLRASGVQEEEDRSGRARGQDERRARARALTCPFAKLSPPRVLYADIPLLSLSRSIPSLFPSLLHRLPYRSTSILNRCHPLLSVSHLPLLPLPVALYIFVSVVRYIASTLV